MNSPVVCNLDDVGQKVCTKQLRQGGSENQRNLVLSVRLHFQNYFRMYEKLSGMTGTALTSKEEFFKVYGLEVATIPTNKPIARVDHDDLISKQIWEV